PDDVWLTIAQGVSRHINFNSEKFRSRFVKHEGQQEIFVDITGVIGSNLEGKLGQKFYHCGTQCGIPKITLEGTIEDWIKLQEKVIQLRKLKLELDFWLDRLELVILKLVTTYRGEIDEDFWSKIMNKYEGFGSGNDTYLSGWILAFFPYDRTGSAIHQYDINFDNFPPPGTVE
ncbi:5524_t:CDS:2, partial [Gigaspora margarita]